jgi:hypothetical protein
MFRHKCQKLFFSDELFQAQLQAQRWASEDVVSVKMLMESDSSVDRDLSQVAMAQNPPSHPLPSQIIPQGMITNGLGAIVSRTNEFFQSPPSTTETESSGSVMIEHQQRHGNINVNGGPTAETTGREYKH